MPSVIALRALLGAGLGLGALDLVWINVAIAPQLVEGERPSQPTAVVAEPAPQVVTPLEKPRALSVEPAVEPTVESAVEPAVEVEVAPITERVYFDTGSAELDTRARKTLEQTVERAKSATEIILVGHADHRGPEGINETLRKDRALSVQHHLVRLGVNDAHIRVTYVGAATSSSELWRDRRVDIQIIGGTR